MTRRFLILLTTLAWLPAFSQRVENVRLEQNDEVALIRYDILDAKKGQTFGVKLLASSDDGITWRLKVSSVLGDVGVCGKGKTVEPGRDKSIRWRILEDEPGLQDQLIKIRVKIQLDPCPIILADADGDQVPDERDECPQVFGRMPNGCPDADKDGVQDDQDKCPYVAGLPELNGCPTPKDSDGDGVPDNSDKCPNQKGEKDYQGCPDSDRDGVPDNSDNCPDEAGRPDLAGCPEIKDADDDGVPDKTDKCPYEAGDKRYKGCPDSDRDGVPDYRDECPRQKGAPSNDGCPLEKKYPVKNHRKPRKDPRPVYRPHKPSPTYENKKVELGPFVTPQNTWILNKQDRELSDSFKMRYTFSFDVGFNMGVNFTKCFGMRSGFSYSYLGQGQDYLTNTAERNISKKLNYLKIPVLLKFNSNPKKKCAFLATMGVDCGFLLNGKTTVDDIDVPGFDLLDHYNGLDLSAVAGMGWQVRIRDHSNLNFMFRASYSMLNIEKPVVGRNDANHLLIGLQIGYNFVF